MSSMARNLTRIATIIIAGTAISGCELQRAQEASDAKKVLLGMSREHVLSCMGSPINAAKAGGTEVWTYASGNNRTDSFGSASAVGGWGFASGFGSSTSTSRSCKIDVVMTEGRVSRINYTGPTGGLLTKGEQCAFAVEACLDDPGTLPIAAADGLPPTQAISPARTPSVLAADVSSTDPVAIDAAAPKECTKEDRELAHYARANGFAYNGNCK